MYSTFNCCYYRSNVLLATWPIPQASSMHGQEKAPHTLPLLFPPPVKNAYKRSTQFEPSGHLLQLCSRSKQAEHEVHWQTSRRPTLLQWTESGHPFHVDAVTWMDGREGQSVCRSLSQSFSSSMLPEACGPCDPGSSRCLCPAEGTSSAKRSRLPQLLRAALLSTQDNRAQHTHVKRIHWKWDSSLENI